MALTDVLRQLASGAYGGEVQRYNAFEDAPIFAQRLQNIKKEQQTNPVIQALQRYGEQYKTATTDEERSLANKLANQIRLNYLAGGGSPMDLPTQYWGSTPAQGFQTSEGFQAPITGFEGLKRTDAMEARRQALLDALTKKQWEMSKEAQDWYLPLTKQTMEANIAKYSTGGGGGGGYSGGSSGSSTLTERINNNLADTYEAVDAAIAAGRTKDEIETSIRNQTPALVRAGVDPELVIGYLDNRYPETPQTNPPAQSSYRQKLKDIISNNYKPVEGLRWLR